MRGLKINFVSHQQQSKPGGLARRDPGRAGEASPNLDAEVEGYVLFLREGTTKGQHLPRVSSFALADYLDRGGSAKRL